MQSVHHKAFIIKYATLLSRVLHADVLDKRDNETLAALGTGGDVVKFAGKGNIS